MLGPLSRTPVGERDRVRVGERVRGQAMVEYVLVLPVLLLLVFGTLQFALIYHAKITLNYAAFEAARAGTLNNAHMWAMQAAAVRGLAPLHTHNDGRQWLRWARGKLWQDVNDGFIKIELVNPSPASFANHGIDTEIDGEDVRAIPNDHLMYRDASVKQPSNQSIQDANVLKIRVLYCYEMVVPFANRIISQSLRLAGAPAGADASGGTSEAIEFRERGVAGNVPPPAGSFQAECLDAFERPGVGEHRRYIPLTAQAIMRMQSPAIQEEP